jgi:hypothetical protein
MVNGSTGDFVKKLYTESVRFSEIDGIALKHVREFLTEHCPDDVLGSVKVRVGKKQ